MPWTASWTKKEIQEAAKIVLGNHASLLVSSIYAAMAFVFSVATNGMGRSLRPLARAFWARDEVVEIGGTGGNCRVTAGIGKVDRLGGDDNDFDECW